MHTVRTKRQQQAADRREQLLKTAFQLFATRGYRGTSVRDIARGVGVTEGLLYHYFSSKAELFTAVLTSYAPLGIFDTLLETSEGRAVDEVLREVGLTFLTFVRERRTFVMTILSEAPADPELGTLLGIFVQRTSERLNEFLSRHQAANRINAGISIEAAVEAFLGGLFLHFLVEAIFARPDATDNELEAAVNSLVQCLLTGFSPQRQA